MPVVCQKCVCYVKSVIVISANCRNKREGSYWQQKGYKIIFVQLSVHLSIVVVKNMYI